MACVRKYGLFFHRVKSETSNLSKLATNLEVVLVLSSGRFVTASTDVCSEANLAHFDNAGSFRAFICTDTVRKIQHLI